MHVGEGRVALDEHACGEGDVELGAQVGDALVLVLAAAIGEQDEGDAVLLEVGERLVGAREGVGAADEDAIDAEGR